MSVINQVLNQLEQRGAHTAAEQTMVRVVHHPRRDFVMPLLAAGFVLVAALAAWQWMATRKPDVVEAKTASKAGNPAGVAEPDLLALQTRAAGAVPAANVPEGEPPVAPIAPASRLSLELGSLPLPDSLRQNSGLALKGGNVVPAENVASTAGTRAGTPAIPVRAKPAAKEKVAASASDGAAPMKRVSVSQQADAEFRRAAGLMQLGRIADAMAGYEAALRLDAGHDAARQALVALLLEGKRNADAEKVLFDGLNSKPEHTGLTMLLARLQVERGALEQAVMTLEKSLPFAETQADYRAFLAALLQRQNRNEEAIGHYQVVLQHAPGNGIWLMGYGISLQAVQRNAEAKDAFQRALDTQTLSPELQAFVQQKIKGL
ncbi:MAG: hypothetical protein HY938_04660 [Nitrosomonadales bacterium]|nr:hypothetical protein [Nitrosomonadales bacterium]